MHHDNHLELHRQRAVELYREAALMRMAHAGSRRRRTLRDKRAYGVLARRVWALRGLNPVP
jgi:hypothetical protein